MYHFAGGKKNEMEVHRISDAYDQGVRDLDSQIGKMWKVLEDAGLLKNTIVVFMSDHGEELFERGDGSHSSFYDSVIHVPLFFVGPGIPAGREFVRMVGLVDVMPTILETVGIRPPPQVEGKSAFAEKDAQDYEHGYTLGLEYVRSAKWKLLRNEFGDRELYYLPFDHFETHNLMDSGDWAARASAKRLTAELETWKLGTAL
jgi:arylsulfatase A-like enzyme